MGARDERVLAAIGDGGRTYQVAGRLRLGTTQTRRMIKNLAALGLVRKNDRFSASNDIYWDLTEAGRQALAARQKDSP